MSSAVERRDRRRLSDSPVDDYCPPSRRSSPRRERLPDHHRSPPRTRSPHRTSSSRRARSPAKERLPDRARSPRKAPLSVPVRTSPSLSPRLDHKSSSRARSPQRTSSSHRARSPAKERLPDMTRSPKHVVRSGPPGSPVPRTKRSRPTQEEHEMEKLVDKEHGRKASRAEHDRRRHKEHGDEFEDQSEKRAKRNKIDDDSSRSLRRERSVSPVEPSHRIRYGSRSPPRVSKSGGRDEVREPRAAQEDMNGEDEAIARMKATEEALEAKQKQKPSFELSGKLAEETNRVRGITLLFTEPPDARKADTRWRLYVFKGGEALNEPLYVHRQTCYLFGRERRVADIPTDHPSCSKQHAVLQYRLVEKEQSDGLLSKQVRPYLMDLGSTNGSFINNNRIEPQRYYELFEQDTIKFGNSSREYVLLHENSAT